MRRLPSLFGWMTGLALAVSSPVMASGTSPLVDVDWVTSHLGADDVVFLDVRNEIDGGSAELFAEGHIPGAVYSDYLKGGWRTEVDGVIAQVPSEAQLEVLFSNLGVENEDTVVVIPAGISSSDFGSAARVYWTFKYAGHDAVSILDGGYRAWTADGDNPIETGLSEPEPSLFEVTLRPELRADAKAVETALNDGETLLLDGRPENQFSGQEKHKAARAAGHIPGAAHFDQAGTFDEKTGRLVDLARLESLLPASLKDADEVVSYCNTGHWASVNWFVLSELMGRKDVRIYDGSMVEWTQDASRPLAN